MICVDIYDDMSRWYKHYPPKKVRLHFLKFNSFLIFEMRRSMFELFSDDKGKVTSVFLILLHTIPYKKEGHFVSI